MGKKLYHVAPYEYLDKIFKEGLFPLETIAGKIKEDVKTFKQFEDVMSEKTHPIFPISASFKARKRLYETFPQHKNSVFFWKEPYMEMHFVSGLPLTIDSEKIPCECVEANHQTTDHLFRAYLKTELGEKVSLKTIDRLEKKYKHSIRPLDKNENLYVTEVMCPCHIPVEAIEIPRLFKEVGNL